LTIDPGNDASALASQQPPLTGGNDVVRPLELVPARPPPAVVETHWHTESAPYAYGVAPQIRTDYTPPTVDEPHEIIASPAGRTVKMACKASGRPPPQIFWFDADNEEIFEHSYRRSLQPYRVKQSVLILEDVVPSDSGMYTCVAMNKCVQHEPALMSF
jgi:hypothetical protein